jgi:transcriptional regulator with XRE-family HTH domain
MSQKNELPKTKDEKGRLLGGLSAQLGQTKSPITDARNISRLQSEFGMTQQQIAQEVGCSQGSISQVLSLLKLPEFLQERLHMNQVTFSTARLLVKLLKLKPDLEPALVKMKTITEDWVDGQYRAAQSANAGLDDLRQPDEDFREMLGLTPLPEPTPDNIALTVSLTNCNMAELRMGNEIEIKIDGQMYVISAS